MHLGSDSQLVISERVLSVISVSVWCEFCSFLSRSLSLVRVGGAPERWPRAGGALQAAWSAGAPGLMPQAGVRWAEVSGCPSPARRPFFPVTQRCLDWNRDILKKELGLTEQDIIDLPALFKMDESRQARAFFPNMVRCSGLQTSPEPSVGAGWTQRDPSAEAGRSRGPGPRPRARLSCCVASHPGTHPAGRIAHPGCPLGPWQAFTLTQWRVLCKFKRLYRQERFL